LQPPPPPLRPGETNWSLFAKGLHYTVNTWTIVELAIAHGFGGKSTPQKVQTMEEEICPPPPLPQRALLVWRWRLATGNATLDDMKTKTLFPSPLGHV